MNVRVVVAGFALAVCLSPVAFSQDEETQPERNSVDRFHYSANYHPKTLLFKVLQFTAPYPGYYYETSLDTSGNAFSARIVPDWAVQASRRAKLDADRMSQVRQMLTLLNLPSTADVLEPQITQLHTAVIFYDGHAFARFNYNGPLPAEVNAILGIIDNELTAASKAQREEVVAHRKLMEIGSNQYPETIRSCKNWNCIDAPDLSQASEGLWLPRISRLPTRSSPNKTAKRVSGSKKITTISRKNCAARMLTLKTS